MPDWNDGYVSDINYTHGYYDDLNPQRLPLLLLSQGWQPPAQLHHACELGFGQGLGVNIHAAAGTARWWGTDFNAAQAGFAQSLAAGGSGALLGDESFAEFCARTDLPDFDFIGLHGIWSWISDDNRATIVDFVRRKLRVGGVLYLSYNCMPGWAAFAPLQHLMARHGDVMGVPGAGSVARVQGALDFVGRLMELKPAYAQANPLMARRLQGLRDKNPAYLAHEYFNRNWSPMHFADVHRLLEPAKLQFAASSLYLDALDVFHLSPQHSAFLAEIPDLALRQSVRDFLVNQQFRREYWIKGGRRIDRLQQAEALRAQRVVLVTQRDQVSLQAKGARGDMALKPEIYDPLLDLMADRQPRTLGQIEQALHARGNFQQWLQAVLVLVGCGHMAPAQDEAAVAAARQRTEPFNRHLMHLARGNGDTGYLASPLTGGGVGVGRFQQLFLLARSQGVQSPQEWARFVSQVLRAQGQRIVKEGQTLEAPEAELAELTRQAQTLAGHLPMLQALQVVS